MSSKDETVSLHSVCVCLSVCHSGRETGDAGGGAEKTDEPSEQHRGEDRQVSSVLSGLNLTFLYSSK